MRLTTLAALAAVLLLAIGAVVASPSRPLSDIQGTTLPLGQWFVPAATPQSAPHSIPCQYYDNPAWPDAYGPGWGEWADTLAIQGHVIEYLSVSGRISQFTVEAKVTNDTYDYPDVLTGTAATYGTFTAPDIAGMGAEPLFDVHFTANFAAKDSGGDNNIYAVGYDELAYYGTSAAEPPVDNAQGSFCVPSWDMGTIAPGASATKILTFRLQSYAASGTSLYNWITSAYDNQADIFASRTRVTKIPMYPTGILTDDGSAWPNFAAADSCNVSVFYAKKPFVTLSQGESTPIEHYWWSGMSRTSNEMLQLKAYASPQSDVDLTGITLQASGTGNDKTEISSVSVYLDEDGSGAVDTGEALLGTGAYDADNGTCTISFTSPVVIPASNVAYLVITYSLSSSIAPEKAYKFSVTGAAAVESGSSTVVPVYGTPIGSCVKKLIAPPQTVLTIGQAKKLPLGTMVMLQGKPVIGDAGVNTYIEESNMTSGIALAASTPDWRHPWYGTDQFVTVIGKVGVQETDGQAVIKDPMLVASTGFVLPSPVAMTCKSVGGAGFGVQRGTVDKMATDGTVATPSCGLNNVGMLVRTWGKVTSVTWDTVWIDDGSGLWDGRLDDFGNPVPGVRVYLPTDLIYDPTFVVAPGDYVQVTGIVTTLAQPDSLEEPKPLIRAIGVRDAGGFKIVKPATPAS